MKKHDINTPEKFLQKRFSMSIDGSIYIRAMMEMLQRLKHVRSQVRMGEVTASVGDLIEYLENEIAYIRYVESQEK